MARKLRYAKDALADLDAIHRWLPQPGSGSAARRRPAAIRLAIRRPKQHPCRGALGAFPGIQELPCVSGYRALTMVEPDTGRSATAGDGRVLLVFGPGQSRKQL